MLDPRADLSIELGIVLEEQRHLLKAGAVLQLP